MKEIGLKAAIFGSDSAMVCVKALKMALSRLERATENNLHVLSIFILVDKIKVLSSDTRCHCLDQEKKKLFPPNPSVMGK